MVMGSIKELKKLRERRQVLEIELEYVNDMIEHMELPQRI